MSSVILAMASPRRGGRSNLAPGRRCQFGRVTAMPARVLCEFLRSGSQRQSCQYKMAASPAGLLGPDGEEHGDAHVREQQPDAADEQGPARSTPSFETIAERRERNTWAQRLSADMGLGYRRRLGGPFPGVPRADCAEGEGVDDDPQRCEQQRRRQAAIFRPGAMQQILVRNKMQ